MSDGFVVRRGGGAGLSKGTAVVFIDSGSTVAAYSNAAATVKVKDAKEVGASGSFYVTGLTAGTYYIKAAKGAKAKISEPVTFGGDGIKTVTLFYAFPVFDNGTLDPAMGSSVKIIGTGTASCTVSTDISLYAEAYNNTRAYGVYKFENPVDLSDYTTMRVRAKSGKAWGDYVYGQVHKVGVNASGSGFVKYVDVPNSGDYVEYTIDISGLSGNHYIVMEIDANSNAAGGGESMSIESIILE